jgi:hypothetical protein
MIIRWSSFKLRYLSRLIFKVFSVYSVSLWCNTALILFMLGKATILLPFVESSPAQQYSLCKANPPRRNVQLRDDAESIDLRTVHKILSQADPQQVAAAWRVAQFNRKLIGQCAI